MLVVVVNFPPIKEGREGEFLEWFAWSNRELAVFKGFVSRRLLRAVQGGTYAAVIEYESREAFAAVQGSPAHDEAGKRVAQLLTGSPSPQLYEVVAG